MTSLDEQDINTLANERDLYLRLLKLGSQDDLEAFLRETLGLVIEIAGAERGYVEIREAASDEAWTLGMGCSKEQLADIQTTISHGIVAEAIATGHTISTHSALLDERFHENASVQQRKIEAVLCAPVGGDPACGVIYLQGCPGGTVFSERDVEHVERLAEHVAPLAERVVLLQQSQRASDATALLRSAHNLDDIVGRSQPLAAALREAMLASPLDVNVLLTGESGTGKSQLARAIHRNSPRRSGPLVEVNCAAIPNDLIESELFGARRGSHSAADRDIEGKVSAAEGGTLFLDEIAELPYDAQSSLLQLLQSREYYALGATTASHANIRLIAATNADLETAVEEKRFRQDLYFRICVLPIELPTLDERREDIRPLATALLDRAVGRHGLPVLSLTPGATRALEVSSWPGNVRQLESVIEAAAIRAAGQGSPDVSLRHAFPNQTDEFDGASALSFQDATRAFQRDFLRRALEEVDWNVSEAARRLELARSHVYNLIKSLGVSR